MGPDDVLNRWAGLMHPLSGGYVDQTRSRFIELWVNGNRGELHVDLGVISEDVNGDGRLDTEDDRSDGFGNNLLEPEEDIGLDGLRDEDETGFDPVTNPDPHGDNFAFEGTQGGNVPVDQVDYSKINGPEVNASDPDQNRRPDTEDLDYSGFLDVQNDYFKFVVNLSPDHEDTSVRSRRRPGAVQLGEPGQLAPVPHSAGHRTIRRRSGRSRSGRHRSAGG